MRHVPSMTTRHVDRAVLAAHHKVVDVSEGEGHGGDSHGLGLLERQLHAVLRRRGGGGGWDRGGEWNSLGSAFALTCTLCQAQAIKITRQVTDVRLKFASHFIKARRARTSGSVAPPPRFISARVKSESESSATGAGSKKQKGLDPTEGRRPDCLTFSLNGRGRMFAQCRDQRGSGS